MLVRVLQLCAAHVALLRGGPLLEQVTWMQLQNAFRLAIMKRHANLCETHPCPHYTWLLCLCDSIVHATILRVLNWS